jgi:hypothetical protein
VILAAGIGLLFSKGSLPCRTHLALVVAAYIAFHLRVNSLMDSHNRFLYPAFPFLLVIALPAPRAGVEGIIGWRQMSPIRLAVGAVLFVGILYPSPGAALRRAAGGTRADAATTASFTRPG